LFSDSFIDDIRKLTDIIIREVVDKSQKAFTTAKNLNWNIALFMKDLLSLMDRGVVFELVSRSIFM
jgi:hypothetical protein